MNSKTTESSLIAELQESSDVVKFDVIFFLNGCLGLENEEGHIKHGMNFQPR